MRLMLLPLLSMAQPLRPKHRRQVRLLPPRQQAEEVGHPTLMNMEEGMATQRKRHYKRSWGQD